MPKKLTLPPKKGAGPPAQLTSETSFVIFGANGSGKSRLGSWIEFGAAQGAGVTVHRISAQRSLAMPESTSPQAVESAFTRLQYGVVGGTPQNKVHYRWGNHPAVVMLSDYEPLLGALFSDEYEVSIKYRLKAKNGETGNVPETKLDKLTKSWQKVLPHRRLLIGGGKVEACMGDDDNKRYNASQMSDGERVIFYLIAQALCAPKDCILIIDEPEIHLHRAIQAPLWDEIESSRPDCAFVYITHDLDFAATRAGATKISVISFDGTAWDYEVLPAETGIPEAMCFEVLGSRNNVLFVEGDKGSLDFQLYRLMYPDMTIVPAVSCENVIHCTKSFRARPELHRIRAFGIIDRDMRPQEELEELKKSCLFTPGVAEIENCFIVEGVLRAVASHMGTSNADQAVESIKSCVLGEFEKMKASHAMRVVRHALERYLITRDYDVKDISGVTQLIGNLASGLDVKSIYETALSDADRLIREGNYPEIIRVFKHRGLVKQIGNQFGLNLLRYVGTVMEILRSGKNQDLFQAIKTELPDIS